LVDESGEATPTQLSEVQKHEDGSLAKGKIWFIVPELPANEQRTWRAVPGAKKGRSPKYKTDLQVGRKKGVWEVTTSKTGVRLLAGEKQFEPVPPARDVAAPLQAIRLRSGKWIGRGWWEAEQPCIGYESELAAGGPVFAEVRVRCLFEGGKHYTASYRIIAGQEVVLIEEEFDLGDPKRFVIPDYDEKYRLQWDWWGGMQGRAESKNNMYFSIYDEEHFAPDTGRWGGGRPSVPEKTPEYKLDFSANRLDVVLNSYLQWGTDESLFYTAWNKKEPRDAVTVLAARPSKWLHPDLLPHTPPLKQYVQTNSLGIWVGKAPDLYLRGPANMGKRAFVIGTLDATTEVAPERKQFDRTGELFVKYAQKPLDKIKDWVLEWPEKARHPLLFCEEGDLAAMQRRAKAWQGPFPSLHGSVFNYLRSGKDKDAVNAFEHVMRGFRRMRDLTLKGYGEPSQHQGWGWTMNAGGADMDQILSSPALSPEQRREARALLAYLQYCAWDPDHFPGRELGFAWGSANQGSIILTARSMWAKLLMDHPMAEHWATEGAKFPIYDLERFLHPESGAGQDCIAYAGVAICSNLTVLFALQDIADLSPIHPRLRALAHWRLTTMPPTDVRFGLRTLVTLGDTPYHGDNVAGVLGMTLMKTDPELAKQCLWAYRRSGRHGAGFVAAPYLIDDSLPDVQPDLSSKWFPGSCAILRTGTGRDDETYLCYYHGSFNWGHHHCDQGTLVFYAKGAPLMMDFGSQYVPRIDRSCFHNTLSFNHRETAELRACPGRDHKDCYYTKRGRWFQHTKEPHTCYEYAMDPWAADTAASLGDVKEFAGLPEADYARGEQRISRVIEVPYRYDKPACDGPGDHDYLDVKPFVWSRQVVLVKDQDPLGPNYFLVHDGLSGNEKLEPAFNLWSLTTDVQVKGNRAFLPGQWGVDLDVFVAEPAKLRTATGEVAHHHGSLNSGNFAKLHKRKFEERQKLLRIFGKPGGGGFALVVYPRKPEEPKPEFAALPDIPGVKVTLPSQTHWVIASRKEVTLKEKEFTFTGTVAVIKQFSDGRTSVSLLTDGRFRSAKQVLTGTGPVHLNIGR